MSAYSQRQSAHRRRVRLRVIELLGGACDCCARTEVALLDIHHKNGRPLVDGRTEKNMLRQGRPVNQILKLPNAREIYGLLCANCHRWQHHGEGPCPH